MKLILASASPCRRELLEQLGLAFTVCPAAGEPAVSGLPPAVFLILLMLVYVVLGFFINSSSGLAVLSIPIMAPLADIVGIPRELIVSAYVYGLGIITFITPTGIVMPSLEVVETTYDRWLKLSIPLVLILTVWGAIMLIAQLMFG